MKCKFAADTELESELRLNTRIYHRNRQGLHTGLMNASPY